MRIENLQNENRKYAKSIENFHVLEYVQDASVSPMNAMNEYFMSKMHRLVANAAFPPNNFFAVFKSVHCF